MSLAATPRRAKVAQRLADHSVRGEQGARAHRRGVTSQPLKHVCDHVRPFVRNVVRLLRFGRSPAPLATQVREAREPAVAGQAVNRGQKALESCECFLPLQPDELSGSQLSGVMPPP